MASTISTPVYKIIGFLAGPVLFITLLSILHIDDLEPKAYQVMAVGAWMVIWWITEAVPLPVTALLPLILFPIQKVFSMADAAAPYADPIIFLFMGGFIIALAMEKRNLHRRIALNIIRLTGTNANGIILGFMLATAFLSMWISNTATTVMMLPIALSVIELLQEKQETADKGYHRFALGLMLCIAYSANIGGTATIIGTPPNVVFVGYMEQFYARDIEFGRWLYVGIPVCFSLLFITYFFITRILFPHRLRKLAGSDDLIYNKLKELGPMRRAEKLVAIIFFLTAICWVFQSQINGLLGGNYLNNTVVAMAGGILMFITPVYVNKQEYILDWKSTERLPWGILLLFGGGLCLAKGMESTGIVEIVGKKIAGEGEMSLWLLILLLTSFAMFTTEVMSNVALTVIFLPVVLGIAQSLDIEPLYLAIPVTLAASCAFMMPVSTPPNAVVFSSGYIKILEMVKAGFFLNLISLLVLLLVALTVVRWVYG